MPLCQAVSGPDVAAREKNQKVMNLVFCEEPVSTREVREPGILAENTAVPPANEP